MDAAAPERAILDGLLDLRQEDVVLGQDVDRDLPLQEFEEA